MLQSCPDFYVFFFCFFFFKVNLFCFIKRQILKPATLPQPFVMPQISFVILFPVLENIMASQVALVVKNPPANGGDLRDTGSIPGSGRSPGEGNGNPLGILAWRIPWTEEPRGLQPMGLPRVRHYWGYLACSTEMRAGQLKRCLNAHRDTQANICQGSSPALAGLDSSPYQQETMASTGGAITALGITSS